MNLFGYSITKNQPVPEKRSFETNIGAWLSGTDISGSGLSNPYTQVVWVYRAVNALAEAIANIPFRFAAAGEGKDRISTGALQDFYARPHPLLNQFQYWELRVIWLMLAGECFRVPVFRYEGGRQVLDRIMILDPSRFRHIVQNGKLEGWEYRSTGGTDPSQSQLFLPEEVWHERLPNPFDPWRGLAPLSVARIAAAGDWAASNYMKALLENNGDAGVIVKSQEPLDTEQREQLLAALRERKRGCGEADRPLLLWGGVEVVQPTAASADEALLAHRKFTAAEICAAFGVPEEVVTFVNAAKYDIARTSRLFFVENRVVPFCRRLEAEEQKTVRAIDKRARGFFEVEEHPALLEARRGRLEMAKNGWAMGIPFNELNRALDLGFKPLPWGDQGWIASNVMTAKQ